MQILSKDTISKTISKQLDKRYHIIYYSRWNRISARTWIILYTTREILWETKGLI